MALSVIYTILSPPLFLRQDILQVSRKVSVKRCGILILPKYTPLGYSVVQYSFVHIVLFVFFGESIL